MQQETLPTPLYEYGVLKKIFSFLPYQDLKHVAKVHPMWKEVVKVVMRGRQSIHWLLWDGRREDDQAEGSLALLHRAKNLFSEPHFTVLFMAGRQTRGRMCDYSEVQSKAISVIDAMDLFYPVVIIWSVGVFGSSSCELDRTLFVHHCNGLSAMTIPHIPGLKVSVFKLGKESFVAMNEIRWNPMSSSQWEQFTGIPWNSDISSLILFMHSSWSENVAHCMMKTISKQQDGHCTFASCLVNDTHTQPSGGLYGPTEEERFHLGIAFTGRKVRSASLILSGDLRQDAAEEKIRSLKMCNLPEQRSFAFGLMCPADSVYVWQEVMCRLFHKYFPSTPLVGVMSPNLTWAVPILGFEYLPSGSEPDGAGSLTNIAGMLIVFICVED